MNKIHDWLYQGNLYDAITAAKGKTEIGCILWFSQGIPLNLTYHSKIPIIHIPINDGRNSIEKMRVIKNVVTAPFLFLNTKVLVACRGGISRSPMMVIYMILNDSSLVHDLNLKDDFDAVYKFVKSKIPEMQPNQSLYRQVKSLWKGE